MSERGLTDRARRRWAVSAEDDPALRALAAVRVGLVLLDAHGVVVHASEAAGELLGAREGELAGRSLSELVGQEDRGSMDSAIELLMAGAVERIRREVHLLCADNGTTRCAELTIRGVTGGCADGRVRAVAILEDMLQRRAADDDGLGFAGTDPLTGLANRRAFLAELQRQVSYSSRYGARGALLVLDIDRLQAMNDAYGHPAGDQAILFTGELLRSRLRLTKRRDRPARG